MPCLEEADEMNVVGVVDVLSLEVIEAGSDTIETGPCEGRLCLQTFHSRNVILLLLNAQCAPATGRSVMAVNWRQLPLQ